MLCSYIFARSCLSKGQLFTKDTSLFSLNQISGGISGGSNSQGGNGGGSGVSIGGSNRPSNGIGSGVVGQPGVQLPPSGGSLGGGGIGAGTIGSGGSSSDFLNVPGGQLGPGGGGTINEDNFGDNVNCDNTGTCYDGNTGFFLLFSPKTAL